MLPWRNWLARSTVNRKIGGSSPPEDVLLIIMKHVKIFYSERVFSHSHY